MMKLAELNYKFAKGSKLQIHKIITVLSSLTSSIKQTIKTERCQPTLSREEF